MNLRANHGYFMKTSAPCTPRTKATEKILLDNFKVPKSPKTKKNKTSMNQNIISRSRRQINILANKPKARTAVNSLNNSFNDEACECDSDDFEEAEDEHSIVE